MRGAWWGDGALSGAAAVVVAFGVIAGLFLAWGHSGRARKAGVRWLVLWGVVAAINLVAWLEGGR